MRRHWKRLAKRASNAACDDQERTQALAGALQHDWNHEIPPGLPGRLRDILDDRQGDLLGDSAAERLEVLRGETANSPWPASCWIARPKRCTRDIAVMKLLRRQPPTLFRSVLAAAGGK